jgi:hypothetical protein
VIQNYPFGITETRNFPELSCWSYLIGYGFVPLEYKCISAHGIFVYMLEDILYLIGEYKKCAIEIE